MQVIGTNPDWFPAFCRSNKSVVKLTQWVDGLKVHSKLMFPLVLSLNLKLSYAGALPCLRNAPTCIIVLKVMEMARLKHCPDKVLTSFVLLCS